MNYETHILPLDEILKSNGPTPAGRHCYVVPFDWQERAFASSPLPEDFDLSQFRGQGYSYYCGSEQIDDGADDYGRPIYWTFSYCHIIEPKSVTLERCYDEFRARLKYEADYEQKVSEEKDRFNKWRLKQDFLDISECLLPSDFKYVNDQTRKTKRRTWVANALRSISTIHKYDWKPENYPLIFKYICLFENKRNVNHRANFAHFLEMKTIINVLKLILIKRIDLNKVFNSLNEFVSYDWYKYVSFFDNPSDVELTYEEFDSIVRLLSDSGFKWF